ncbi:hypothetical protein CRM22_002411, partial [Opisthorchis felineus]
CYHCFVCVLQQQRPGQRLCLQHNQRPLVQWNSYSREMIGTHCSQTVGSRVPSGICITRHNSLGIIRKMEVDYYSYENFIEAIKFMEASGHGKFLNEPGSSTII